MPPDRSTPLTADRNLLFGIMALQMDFISRDHLIAAMNAWVLDKGKSLGQILAEQGALRKEDRDLLEGLIKRHLQMHGDNVQKSLAALNSVGFLHDDLQNVADADVHASLAFVAGRPPSRDDPYITRPSLAGQPSVPGMRFRILREHARGGLGAVFVAMDEELHREVALKEIHEKYAHHAESQSRFLLEAEVTGGLEHPGVVPVYGLGRYPDGRPFYAMRFIRGDSLREAIERFYAADDGTRDPGERSLAFRELLGHFVAACNALAYAHARSVLHRDVKPHNIMLGKYGETLVVDWGLAKVLGDRDGQSKSEEDVLLPSSSGDSTPTQAGHVLGTPAYMSPEQAEGRLDALGPAADIYSLGATLYELLTGQASVQGRHGGEVLVKVKRGDWLPPRKVRKDVPAPLDAICRKALALRPEDRYATALELAVDIEHWLADEPVTAYREPWSWKLRRWVRRHRGLAAGVAGLLLTAVAALAVGIVVVNKEKNRTEEARLKTRLALDQTSSLALDGWLSRQKSGKLEPAQQEFLESMLKSYQDFANEPGAGEDARSGVAAAHLRLGEIHRWLGHSRDSEEAYRGAIDCYKELVVDFPKAEDYRRALAKCSGSLATLLREARRFREAERVFRDGLANQKKLVEEFPAAAKYRQDLAGTYNDLANLLKDTGRAARGGGGLSRSDYHQQAISDAVF
jgi:serine/threonine protein kinase